MALWTVGYDVCLAIYFELWQYCTTVFAAVVPRRCVVFRSKLSAVRCAAWVSRPPTVGVETAIAWWRCREEFWVSLWGISVQKGGTRRENCCDRRSFCFTRTKKSGDAVSYLSLFCLSLHQTSKYLSFLPNQLLCVFFKYSLSRVCVCSPCSVL